jgi:hypothetical protein
VILDALARWIYSHTRRTADAGGEHRVSPSRSRRPLNYGDAKQFPGDQLRTRL